MNISFWQKLETHDQTESILVGLLDHSNKNMPVTGDQHMIDELLNQSLLKTTFPPLKP